MRPASPVGDDGHYWFAVPPVLCGSGIEIGRHVVKAAMPGARVPDDWRHQLERAARKFARLAVLGAPLLLGACAGDVREPVVAHSFALTSDQVAVGALGIYVTREEDTLLDIARQFDLGYTQLVTANQGIDPWRPGGGRRITVPSLYLLPEGARRGIVINLVQNRLYYFAPGGGTVETHPIGVGVQGRSTPIGTTHIVAKRTHPTWIPPPSIRRERPKLPAVVSPGADNPLGDYAFQLGWPSYLIHGTNKPDGIGRNVSHGCIQLYPEDVERLFGEVAVGTPVRVVNEEVQTAWIGGDLYLAVYPTKEQADQLDVNETMKPVLPPRLKRRVAAAAGDRAAAVDWEVVERAGRDRTGVPVRVTFTGLRSTMVLH
jgi:L,D-transpeptidase ErfK/SrfK